MARSARIKSTGPGVVHRGALFGVMPCGCLGVRRDGKNQSPHYDYVGLKLVYVNVVFQYLLLDVVEKNQKPLRNMGRCALLLPHEILMLQS